MQKYKTSNNSPIMRKPLAFSLFMGLMLSALPIAGANVDPQRGRVLLIPSFDGKSIIIDVQGPTESYHLVSPVFAGMVVKSPFDMIQEVDLDDDGNKDLLISSGSDENNVEHSCAFIWDATTHRFALVEAFDELKNPMVDGKRFCIMSFEKQNNTIYESCYVLQETKLHCVRTTQSDYESWITEGESALADCVSVFLTDDDGDYTNIRNRPGGKTVVKLPHNTSYGMTILNPTNGWWQIDPDLIYEADDDMMEVVLSGSTTGYWLHHSVVGVTTRNYDPAWRVGLRSEADESAPVTHWLAPETLVHPVDVDGDWVKMVTADGKHTGWITTYWLCDNPLTTCP